MSSSIATDPPGAQISANRVAFNSLIDEAERAVEAGRYRSGAVSLQSAARFGWYNHPGFFQSTELERLAIRIGQQLPRSTRPLPNVRGQVVHVLSQAYSAGGHTRLVWRWIENDDSRVHSVILTGQQGVPVPQDLSDAVRASGGQIVSLGETSSNLLVRAAELRRLAVSGPEAVVLHVHPYDVIPVLALHDTPAPVVFLNHADHVFWIGGAVADVLADIRPAGRRLSAARRSAWNSRSAVLPLPLGAPPTRETRGARDELGIDQDAVVLLSIASGYKYGATPGNHFVDIHREFILAHPNVTLIVVGPESHGRWKEVSEETNGRFRAVGMVQGISSYYDAADIYLDSIPFASLTSLLDAAARGIPVLALNETVPDSVLTSNDLSLVGQRVHHSDRGEYIRALSTLVNEPAARYRRANATGTAVAADHLSPSWNQHLEALFELLRQDQAPDTASSKDNRGRGPERLDEALVEFQVASGLAEPLWSCRLRDAPYLTAADRVRLLFLAPADRRVASLKFMIPDSLRSRIKSRLSRRSRRLGKVTPA